MKRPYNWPEPPEKYPFGWRTIQYHLIMKEKAKQYGDFLDRSERKVNRYNFMIRFVFAAMMMALIAFGTFMMCEIIFSK
jgi:hypothetical protein